VRRVRDPFPTTETKDVRMDIDPESEPPHDERGALCVGSVASAGGSRISCLWG